MERSAIFADGDDDDGQPFAALFSQLKDERSKLDAGPKKKKKKKKKSKNSKKSKESSSEEKADEKRGREAAPKDATAITTATINGSATARPVAVADVAAASRPSIGKKRARPAKSNTSTAPVTGGAGGVGERHPFETEYGDHFETPLVAYRHLKPVLEAVARELGKTPGDLRIYDPFYCEGAMVQRMASLGFENVRNENVDFWQHVEEGDVPEFDVLVTNPPYSGDHKERVFEFCLNSGKPWALLLPNYVATKQYYTASLAKQSMQHGRGGGGGGGEQQPFYIVPQSGLQYQYTHPEGTGHRCGWGVRI